MTRFGFLSTYPPTRCGLATFTAALVTALISPGQDQAIVVRVDDLVPAGPATPGAGVTVAARLHPGDPAGVSQAVEILNTCDAVIVQHEFGIYGGRDGAEILELMERLRAPSIVVLHTVLAQPTAHQRALVTRLGALADAVVVMTQTAMHLLPARYGIASERVHLIPHGVHPWAELPAAPNQTRPVVLTWGLIGPGKGIEWGIRAMAQLRALSPAPIYRVLGQTHPKVVLEAGEQYRESLQGLVGELALTADVEIDGRYRATAELAAEVAAADIVLLPYESREQATSGVLAEAVAAGKLVIATRFPHAVELLGDGGGMIVDHERPDQIAAAVRVLLNDPSRAREAAERAAQDAQSNSWHRVAARYRELAADLRRAGAVR